MNAFELSVFVFFYSLQAKRNPHSRGRGVESYFLAQVTAEGPDSRQRLSFQFDDLLPGSQEAVRGSPPRAATALIEFFSAFSGSQRSARGI